MSERKMYFQERTEKELGVKLDELTKVNFGMGTVSTYYDGKDSFYYFNESTGHLSKVSENNVFLPMLKQRYAN